MTSEEHPKGQEASFLGAPVSKEKQSIAQGDGEGNGEPEAGDGRPITPPAKLTPARTNAVPMASYAPLVETDSPAEQHESFDRQVGEALRGILGSDPKRRIEFLAAPKRNGGLGVHLPGVYHKQLRDAFDTLDVRTGHREPVAERDDLTVNTGSYINHVFGRS